MAKSLAPMSQGEFDRVAGGGCVGSKSVPSARRAPNNCCNYPSTVAYRSWALNVELHDRNIATWKQELTKRVRKYARPSGKRYSAYGKEKISKIFPAGPHSWLQMSTINIIVHHIL